MSRKLYWRVVCEVGDANGVIANETTHCIVWRKLSTQTITNKCLCIRFVHLYCIIKWVSAKSENGFQFNSWLFITRCLSFYVDCLHNVMKIIQHWNFESTCNIVCIIHSILAILFQFFIYCKVRFQLQIRLNIIKFIVNINSFIVIHTCIEYIKNNTSLRNTDYKLILRSKW